MVSDIQEGGSILAFYRAYIIGKLRLFVRALSLDSIYRLA